MENVLGYMTEEMLDKKIDILNKGVIECKENSRGPLYNYQFNDDNFYYEDMQTESIHDGDEEEDAYFEESFKQN